MEVTEVDEFRKQVEEGGEQHMRAVSLIICVLAALVATVTVLGHRTHTEAVLNQAKASDLWNEYQAKKIRQHEDILSADALGFQPYANQEAAKKKIEDYKSHAEKVNGDLEETQEKAKDFEAEVRMAERKASRYDLGEAFLQIAVVLSSVTLLTRQRLFVTLGGFLGLAGLLVAASAFLVK